MSSNTFQYVPWATDLWKKTGFTATPDAIMLDLGCGIGDCVHQFRQAGYQTFGCDFTFPDNSESLLKLSLEHKIIKTIETNPYKIPFEDNTFDLVFSFQVFEHIMDYSATLAEIKRVLKSDGVSIHVFPGRWKVRESHVYVPLSSVIRTYWWLKLWALWGIRNEFQAGLSASETAKRNKFYLTQQTNYLSRKQIQKYVTQYFRDCRFVEEAYFWISPRFNWYTQKFPFLLSVYRAYFSDTEMRVLAFGNKL